MDETPKYRFIKYALKPQKLILCGQNYLKRIGPSFHTYSFMMLVCMGMIKNIPKFPLRRFLIYRDSTYIGYTVQKRKDINNTSMKQHRSRLSSVLDAIKLFTELENTTEVKIVALQLAYNKSVNRQVPQVSK